MKLKVKLKIILTLSLYSLSFADEVFDLFEKIYKLDSLKVSRFTNFNLSLFIQW
ncbi:hypothetical protein [Sulfurihydrogenibium azorense]|uniref:Uncharacterized protein n=1 Tax=Sulfurihydrogenibium azorense (strain DSM 15241 / OCM 825 / Az-Fu1) TaxID=204536 RepID=C1DUD6_SULAA|nr:hypothetical protein [Sulfurihydrogenibium azorense]ACN99028.1 hypothetical protein SULAZ_0738 [Sulfurihydrogenibium azorense Az-Fu1]